MWGRDYSVRWVTSKIIVDFQDVKKKKQFSVSLLKRSTLVLCIVCLSNVQCIAKVFTTAKKRGGPETFEQVLLHYIVLQFCNGPMQQKTLHSLCNITNQCCYHHHWLLHRRWHSYDTANQYIIEQLFETMSM